jgi:glyoxylate reductase
MSQLDATRCARQNRIVNWSVFVTRRIPTAGPDLLRKNGVRVDGFDDDLPIPTERLHAEARERDGLLVMGSDPVDAALFDTAPKLKGVSVFGTGHDRVDVAEATRRKIVVVNTPDAVTEATADITWALILAVARRVVEGEQLVRTGEWPGWAPLQLHGSEIVGKTLGIVGAGRIGTAVARRATGFSMRILYFSRRVHPEIQRLGAKRVEFDEILRESDFLCVHVPLTPETRHMFGEKEFRAMKPSAFFINVARGAVHVEAALVKALREKWIAGAGLDVYEHEPKLAPGLAELPNTVLLPHLGSATVETRERMSLEAATNLLMVLRGERCPNQVNPF